MAHVAHPEHGCPVAALCSEIAHEGRATKAAFTVALKRLLEVVASAKVGRRRQLQSAAAAVGALVLARASDDPRLASEILSAVREGLKD